METRFREDLSDVRIHTDAAAAASAAAIHARAYTAGRHIVFAPGAYQPGSAGGRRLLAHEIAHVIQQSSVAGRHQEGSTPTVVQRTVYNHDPDWERRVAAATSDTDRIALLNEAADADRSAYPSLLLPIEPLPAEERDRRHLGVYYDPDQSDPGGVQARPRFFQRRIPFTDIVISRRSEPAPPNPDVPGERRTGFYVTLGPGALSSHNRVQTQRVLYHEYIHLRQNTGAEHRGFLDPIAQSGRPYLYSAAKEALAHAMDFARYFRHLHFDASNPWERVEGGRVPHDALHSLVAIEREYWPTLLVTGGEPIRRRVIRIVANAASNDDERARLTLLIGHLSGTNRVGQRTDFKPLLLEAVQRADELILEP